jgi:hypothetical protein
MEALVNPKTGEVICIKPDGAMWGREEKRLLQIVQWDPSTTADRAVEATLNASKVDHPVVIHPFTKVSRRKPFPQAPEMDLPVLEEVGEVDGHKVYANECTRYADLTELPDSVRKDILDPKKFVPKITSGVKRPSVRPNAVESDVQIDVQPGPQL